jgi:hypothetical protein
MFDVDRGVGDPLRETVDYEFGDGIRTEFLESCDRSSDDSVDRFGVRIFVRTEAWLQHPDPPSGQRNVDAERVGVAACAGRRRCGAGEAVFGIVADDAVEQFRDIRDGPAHRPRRVLEVHEW